MVAAELARLPAPRLVASTMLAPIDVEVSGTDVAGVVSDTAIRYWLVVSGD
jgi:hypothetical protein